MYVPAYWSAWVLEWVCNEAKQRCLADDPFPSLGSGRSGPGSRHPAGQGRQGACPNGRLSPAPGPLAVLMSGHINKSRKTASPLKAASPRVFQVLRRAVARDGRSYLVLTRGQDVSGVGGGWLMSGNACLLLLWSTRSRLRIPKQPSRPTMGKASVELTPVASGLWNNLDI